MQTDCRGLALTTDSEGAAKHIDRAVTDFLDYGVTASAQVKAALESDPAFVLAQCFRGYFLLMLENRAILPRVQQTLDEIRPHLARGHAAGTVCMSRRWTRGRRATSQGVLSLGGDPHRSIRSTCSHSSCTTP